MGVNPLLPAAPLSRRNFLRAGLAGFGAVAGASLLAACGSDSSSSSSGGGGARSSTITIGTVVVDDTLNPMQEQYTTFQFNAFDALVRKLRGQNEPTPRLAQEWTRTSDTVWRFRLRSGVTFHDGSPVTADDIVFSFTEVLDKQYALASVISGFAGVRKIDETTIEIETKAPDPLLLDRVGQIFVVPKAHWEKVGPDGFNNNPIGCGPYRITSFSPDRGIEFSVYDGFYGTKPPTPEISLRYFTDAGALASALEAGEIDAAQNLGAETIQTLGGRDDITIHTDFGGSQSMFQLNTTKPPFDDIRVRQAAIKAVNAPALIDAITYGAGVLEDGQLPVEGVTGYTPTIKRPAYDPEEARSLLRAAGAEGAQIEIFGMNIYKSLYEAIGAQLQEVGFRPTINAVEVALWVQSFRNGSDAHIFYRGASYTGIFDADRVFTHVSSSAKPFVVDPTWDQLMAAQRAELDPAARQQKLIDCSKHLLDQSYILYTFGGPAVSGTRAGVSGYDNANGILTLFDNITKQA